jgi:hypothetical protein
MPSGDPDAIDGIKELRYEHFETMWKDVRDEVKLRIRQRDTYSIQMTVALGTIVGLATTATATTMDNNTNTSIISYAYRAMVAAPLIAIYYTTLILYSYRIHRLLAKYTREVLEPEMAKICRTKPDWEWESWYCQNAVPGIRKSFFMVSLWVMTIGSPVYVAFAEKWQGPFLLPLAIISGLYLIAALWVTIQFWKG